MASAEAQRPILAVVISLDSALLLELGLRGLTADEQRALLSRFYSVLTLRVGSVLGASMTEDELDMFERFINDQDEGQARRWLEETFPRYKSVVTDELSHMKSFIADRVDDAVRSQSAANVSAPVGQ